MPTWLVLQIQMANQIGLLYHFLSFGLTLDCHFFKFSFIFYLDLLSIASSFYFFTYLDLPPSASLVVLWLVYLIGLTPLMLALLRFFENSDLSELPSSFRRSFWSFYRVQDPLSFCIPISYKRTNIWCKVSCNVWLCTNEVSKHFFWNLFFFFIFPCFNECEMQMSYANAMIGFTNALCNHCAPICYW